MATKWNCAICSKQILWSELFTFYSKGAVHFSCFKDAAKGDQRLLPLLDLLEAELRIIVSYKKSLNEYTDDIKRLLEDNEKDAEKHAALLTKFIEKMMH